MPHHVKQPQCPPLITYSDAEDRARMKRVPIFTVPQQEEREPQPYELQVIEELRAELDQDQLRHVECAAGRRKSDHEQSANIAAYLITLVERVALDTQRMLDSAALHRVCLESEQRMRQDWFDRARDAALRCNSAQTDLQIERNAHADTRRQLADALQQLAIYTSEWHKAHPPCTECAGLPIDCDACQVAK